MEEKEVKTAETNQAEIAESVGNENDNANEVEFTDGNNETNENENAEEKQTKEQNREYARKRREKERADELEKAKTEAIIEAVGTNPYTNEKISNKRDVEEYLRMKKISDNGGNPIEDYSKQIKKEQIEDDKSKENEWYEKDKKDFNEKYPNKLNGLINDKDFNEFASDLVGRVPLSTIYEKYLKTVKKEVENVKDDGKNNTQTESQAEINSKASPGSLKTTGEATQTYFTREEVLNMSEEQIKKNYDKIRKSMTKW